jgi:hypothetical protein
LYMNRLQQRIILLHTRMLFHLNMSCTQIYMVYKWMWCLLFSRSIHHNKSKPLHQTHKSKHSLKCFHNTHKNWNRK